MSRSASLLLFLLFAISFVQSQSVTSNGTPTFTGFSGQPDVINDQNLNIHYDIPVFSRAGVEQPFSFSLPIDNGSWYISQVVGHPNDYNFGYDPATAQPAVQGSTARQSGFYGLLGVGGVFYKIGTRECVYQGQKKGSYATYSTTSYTGPDNTSHPVYAVLYGGNCYGQWTNTPTGIAGDGSGLSVTISFCGNCTNNPLNATVTLANGTVINPPTVGPSTLQSTYGVWGSGTYTITDTNNNQITISAPANSNQLTSIRDTLGTNAITSTGGPPPNATYYTYTAPSGAQASVAVTYENVTIESDWGCNGTLGDVSFTNQNLVSRVTLPDETYYQFYYESGGGGNPTGRISEVVLPTGGSISYAYMGGDTGKGISCLDGSTTGFNRTSSQSGTVQYRRTVKGNGLIGVIVSSSTQITDNSGNVTNVAFYNGSEIDRKVYQGPASGTPLEEVITCYSATNPINPSTCLNPTSILQPASRITTFRSLNGGPQSEIDTYYNAYGLVTKRDVYGWGASSYTQETQTTYDSTLGDGILDHPSSILIVDGAGNPKAETAYSYDDFAISGDTKTCAPAAKCRGNLTKLTRYSSISTFLTTQRHYNLNGTVATSLDPNGTTTTYTYGSGGCGAFPTQTKVTFGSTTLGTTAGYNCTGAALTLSTDANQKSTSTSYTDPYFWRPHGWTDQLENVTTYTYPQPTVVETAMPFNGNNSTVDAVSTFDGFGRLAYSQRRQGVGSSNFDSIQQVYDATGRPYEVSMPYQGTQGQAPASGIYTQTSYDAMMRPITAQDAGGGIVSTSYSQNDVYQEIAPKPTGENYKQKQLEYDGLGRLTSVCEITSDPMYSGSCGQITGGYSGYLTKYTYDTPPNVNSVTVMQNVQPNGGTSQTRNYYYDMLARLTYETNPESGATTYSYDSDSSGICPGSFVGDLIKRVDNATNVTCYTYDGLRRVTTISYPSGPNAASTPTKTFVYDTTSFSCPTGANVVGRLAEAFTGTSTNKITDRAYCYSPRGEVTDIYSSTLNSGGFYHITETYWPHGTVASLGGIPGVPTIYYGGTDGSGLDGEGRVTKVTASSGQGPVTCTTSPCVSYNLAGRVTNVVFGSGDSDAYQYDPNTGRMTQYTFNVNGQSVIGKTTWNPNGTLGQFQVTQDPFNPGNVQTCAFNFDDLARTKGVNCPSVWSQTFTYDPFGNITKSGSSSWIPNYASPSNNQYQTGWNLVSYDADGHLTYDTFHTYQWDTDGHPVVIDSSSTETYDAMGHMVELSQPGWLAQYLYDESGFEFGFSKAQSAAFATVPLPGGGRALYSGATLQSYGHVDWLGTTRLSSGASAGFSGDQARAPFGESYAVQPGHDAQIYFAGMLPNIVGDLDDTLYREYSPVQGRWISPDPAGLAAVDPTNPQSWNRYAYALNKPLSNIDPSGLECVWDDGSFDSKDDPQTGSISGCTGAGGHYFEPSTFTAGNGQDWSATPNADIAQLVASAPAIIDSPANSGNSSSSGTSTTINLFGSNWDITQFREGTHPWRDNNPGDIVSGPFTSRNGQLGTDGRFAVFPTSETGRQAMDTLLHGGAYINLSINDAVDKYAPAFENNTASYQQFLTNALGVSGNTSLSSLSPAQFQTLEMLSLV